MYPHEVASALRERIHERSVKLNYGALPMEESRAPRPAGS
jgi:hypothetical protein